MKILGWIIPLLITSNLLISQNLQPYILGTESNEQVATIKEKVKTNLEGAGLSIAGQYQPANDNNRWILIITASELQNAVKTVGGLTGFAATLRVAITREGDVTNVSYTNPVYWGNAYFRNDYDQVATNYNAVSTKLKTAMEATGTYLGKEFGSKKGMSPSELRKYHYMMGMPYFDDTVVLGEFGSYQEAIDKIESSLKKGVANVKLVYKVAIPGKNTTLYGFGLSGEDGESKFLPIIDISTPKHTAFLPYEVLVVNNQVHMLHGRYRIALSFPDLTMGTFTKIMSTPGNIEDMLLQLVK